MKTGLLLLISIFSIPAFGQLGKLKLSLTITADTTYPYFLDIWLRTKDSIVTKFAVVKSGDYYFQNLKAGIYDLSFADRRTRELKVDSLAIFADSVTNLTLAYPGQCRFIYPADYSPKCPYNHKDSIIEIKYGFPTKKMWKQAKKGLIHLAGCIRTDCDPKYYCVKHKEQF